MKKLSVLAIGAVGYVLGSRAGRERYEQIKGQATKLWNRPVVQDAAGNVEQAVKSTASDVGSKIADVAGDASSKVVSKVKGDKDPDVTTSGGASF
ncbi:hypothetical protein GCM10022234_14920 [Aeromicrobium panaciterrae]|uniref:hypothetical protein n=1 Tax=Aeromicrobium panaciterrae TaxID=363861 RepID=UPI0031CE3191